MTGVPTREVAFPAVVVDVIDAHGPETVLIYPYLRPLIVRIGKRRALVLRNSRRWHTFGRCRVLRIRTQTRAQWEASCPF